MDSFFATFTVGHALTLAGWAAGGLTFSIGSFYAFRYGLKRTGEQQTALQAELRRLSESVEGFTREARNEIQAVNARVDHVADRTSRLEERQAFAEGLLGKMDQRMEEHMRYVRDRIDALFSRLSGR